jgi:hypothetical protein
LSGRRVAIALGAVALAAAGIAGAYAYVSSRDDATLKTSAGPGEARDKGARPVVAAGNVLLLYADPRQAPELRALARDLGGAGAALRAAGQAVLIRRSEAPVVGVAALSRLHRIEVLSASDPALRAFVEHWLGRSPG